MSPRYRTMEIQAASRIITAANPSRTTYDKPSTATTVVQVRTDPNSGLIYNFPNPAPRRHHVLPSRSSRRRPTKTPTQATGGDTPSSDEPASHRTLVRRSPRPLVRDSVHIASLHVTAMIKN